MNLAINRPIFGRMTGPVLSGSIFKTGVESGQLSGPVQPIPAVLAVVLAVPANHVRTPFADARRTIAIAGRRGRNPSSRRLIGAIRMRCLARARSMGPVANSIKSANSPRGERKPVHFDTRTHDCERNIAMTLA